MANQARNDGELRTAYFGMAVVESDRGHFDKALAAMDKEFAVAEKQNDAASMSADLQAKGNILLAAQKYDDAAKQFERSLEITENSSLSQEIKDNARLQDHFDEAAVAIGKKDYATAQTHITAFRQGAEAGQNPAQLKQVHELAGRLALAQKNYEQAIAELKEANQQNPANLYRLSLAYKAKGDANEAHDYAKRAGEFNSLPQLPYAFIRAKAEKG